MIIFLLFICFWIGLSFRYQIIIFSICTVFINLLIFYRYRKKIGLIAVGLTIIGVGISYIKIDVKKESYSGIVIDSHPNYFLILSGGEKRRLAVACMLAMDLPVIILDEPYANLDYGGVKQVNALVKQLKLAGKTVIILTHEIEKCLALADKFAVLFRGEKKFEGLPQDGLLQPLEEWNIRNPLVSYSCVQDLVW